MTIWMDELAKARDLAGDESELVYYASDEAAFNVEFNPDFAVSQGPPVLAWTEARVYFPVVMDGVQTMNSAPRNPEPAGQPAIFGDF